jgi:hypothetical protein
MSDPFLDGEGGSLLEKEVGRLRLENRELRLTNTNLRARLALATPNTSISGEVHRVPAAGAEPNGHAVTNSDADNAAATAATAEQQQQRETPRRRARGSSSSNGAASSVQVSTARIQEAVQQVRKELQGELEKHRTALAAEKAAKEQLKREFELFVSTTCEREAAYQLVYAQLFREMEEEKELVRSAQAQLEEQRLQSVEMRKSLEAAVAAARSTGVNGGVPDTSCSTARPTTTAAGDASAEAQPAEDGDTAPTAKRQRTTKEVLSAPAPRQHIRRLPKDLNWVDLAGVTSLANAATPAHGEAEMASVSESSAVELAGPRQLKIIAGGAALRKSRNSKRGRDSLSESSLSASRPAAATRRSANNTLTSLHVPVAPVFVSAAAKVSPSTARSKDSHAAAAAEPHKHTDTRALHAGAIDAPQSSSTSSAAPTSAAVEALWRLLAKHTEATQGFLPLWQHLAALRGPDRQTTLRVLVSVLVHLLGPDAQTPAAGAARGFHRLADFSSLPASFTSQSTSITVVATAIRLLAVQLEEAKQQQRSSAEALRQSHMLLNSLFYRVCVATLCRWQVVADGGADALEQWATAVIHLYGFQPDLLRLMQYTNTTAAYHRTRLAHSWITYTARCIFALCFTVSSSSLAEATAAASHWQELCDSVGWSPHALPLERIETAAARCVATTRVGHGPLTASCAEEALLSLRLVVLYKGFDHMEQIAKLLEQPGVLPMAITKEIYAELVSLAVRDRIPFRTQDALHHALRLLREYLQEVGPERCTSAEHFVSAPRRSHVLAALTLLRVESHVPSASTSEKEAGTSAPRASAVATASEEVREEGRAAALQWLQAQKVALEMVRQSRALSTDRPLLLRDTPLGRVLLSDATD